MQKEISILAAAALGGLLALPPTSRANSLSYAFTDSTCRVHNPEAQERSA
jgi:hypothetical protein